MFCRIRGSGSRHTVFAARANETGGGTDGSEMPYRSSTVSPPTRTETCWCCCRCSCLAAVAALSRPTRTRDRCVALCACELDGYLVLAQLLVCPSTCRRRREPRRTMERSIGVTGRSQHASLPTRTETSRPARQAESRNNASRRVAADANRDPAVELFMIMVEVAARVRRREPRTARPVLRDARLVAARSHRRRGPRRAVQPP